MASKAPKYPKPTAQEQQLQAFQLQSLQDQRSLTDRQLRTQDLLAPFQYKALGLTPTYGPSRQVFNAAKYLQDNPDVANSEFASNPLQHWQQFGQAEGRPDPGMITQQGDITGFTEIPKTQEELNQQEILRLGQQREMDALQGKLPVDASLMSDLAQRETDLRSKLEKQYGPGYETSTGASQALSDFERARQATLDAVRRGDINTGEALNLSQTGLINTNTANFLNQSAGVNQLGNQYAGMFGQNAAGYQNPLSLMQQDRSNQYGAAYRAYQTQPNAFDFLGGLIGGASQGAASFGGTPVGAPIGAGVGALSGLLGAGSSRRGY